MGCVLALCPFHIWKHCGKERLGDLSFICPGFSGWAKILTLISWFKYRAFIVYILLFILWHRVILMIFGMHTSVVFTENRSIFKRGHSACNDSCLASRILPVLAFPHLFHLSVHSFSSIHLCLNQIVCLLLLEYSVLSLTYHVFPCLKCHLLYSPTIEYQDWDFWDTPQSFCS